MKGFEDVTIGWDGKEYVIPANKQLMLIAKLEATLGGETGRQAVEVLTQPSGPSYAVLAMSYGAALRYAGANVSDDEIYLSIHEGFASGDTGMATFIQGAILALLSIISPPLGRALMDDETDKPVAPAKKKAAAA